MPHPFKLPASEAECLALSESLGRRMRFLWVPGRRKKLAAESFGMGQACRHYGNAGLAATHFRRVQTLLQGRRPTRSKDSLEKFALIASSHNHMGLLCLDASRPMDARPFFDRAIEIRTELQRLFPDDRENRIYLGGALCNRAHAVADANPAEATDFYQRSLAILRQPTRPCECSYWDEQRQSWWCAQLEAMADALNLRWVFLAPQFIDSAMQGLRSLEPPPTQQVQ